MTSTEAILEEVTKALKVVLEDHRRGGAPVALLRDGDRVTARIASVEFSATMGPGDVPRSVVIERRPARSVITTELYVRHHSSEFVARRIQEQFRSHLTQLEREGVYPFHR